MLTQVGTMQNIKRGSQITQCIGPEGQQRPYSLWLWHSNTFVGKRLANAMGSLCDYPNSISKSQKYYGQHGLWSFTKEIGFFIRATVKITALLLKWETDEPIWTEQWPLSKVKLVALQELVKKQYELGHIFFFFLPFLGLLPQQMEFSRLGIELEL